MWHLVARGNIQQISYIPKTEQHSPFGLMLLRLGNVTIIYSPHAGHLRSCNCFVGSLRSDTNCTAKQSTSYIAVA